MKNLTCTIVLCALTACSSFGQDFFPMNLKSLIEVVKVEGKSKIIPNSYYLNEKEFFLVDDLFFVNKKTTERVKFSSNVNGEKEELRVDYYSIAKDLSRFIKRAGESGLKKLNENRFEHRDKNTTIRIDIKRNVQIDGKIYNLLSLVVIDDLPNGKTNVENGAIKFSADYSYPLQNATYFFDAAL